MFITIQDHIFNINCISSVRFSTDGTSLFVVTTNDREFGLAINGRNKTEQRANAEKLFSEISEKLSQNPLTNS